MNAQKEMDALYNMVSKMVKKEMNKRENYPPMMLPGEIDSVNGNFADVTINGSTEITPNIPVCPHVTVVPGSHVWIAKINYSNTDLLIWTVRPTT